MLLTLPLVLGIMVLVPEQPAAALGVELLLTGLVFRRCAAADEPPVGADRSGTAGELAGRAAGPSAVVPALVIVAGISLVVGAGGGLYWFAPAVLLAFIAGLANAWVLLVEILR